MKLKLYPGKIAVQKTEAKLKGGIALPVSRSKAYDIGQVICTGDLTKFGYRGEEKTVEDFKPGDLVLFQLPISVAQFTVHKIKDVLTMILNVGDIIARLDSDIIEMESFHVAGRFLLLEPNVRQASSIIVVPETAVEMNRDSLHFSMLQKGADVTLDIYKGQEVYPNRGRVNPIVVDNTELCFVDQQFIDGVLSPD